MSTTSKIALALEMIESAESTIRSAKQLLLEVAGGKARQDFSQATAGLSMSRGEDDSKVLEGVFNGQAMLGADGNMYPVPANYASKSKLVPGDVLKLTIKNDGALLYKQIGPVERRHVAGTLIQEDGKYKVLAEGKLYNILLASVTFYRGEPGDRVSVLLPMEGDVEWAALEAILPSDVPHGE